MVSNNIGDTLLSAILFSFYFTKIQEIFYMIGTRILEIDSEIAEIFGVKDSTCYLEIDILLLQKGKKI